MLGQHCPLAASRRDDHWFCQPRTPPLARVERLDAKCCPRFAADSSLYFYHCHYVRLACLVCLSCQSSIPIYSMPFLPDDAQGPTGFLSRCISRLAHSRRISDPRSFYRLFKYCASAYALSDPCLLAIVGFALFAMSVTAFLNALVLILSMIKLAIFDCRYK